VLFNRKHIGWALDVSKNWDDDFEVQREGDLDEQRSCKGQPNGNSSKNEGRNMSITTLEDWDKERVRILTLLALHRQPLILTDTLNNKWKLGRRL